MTKNYTVRQKADLLIDYLSDKTLKLGCVVGDHVFVGMNEETGCYYLAPIDCNSNVISERGSIDDEDVVGSPVMIGDILQKMRGVVKGKPKILEFLMKWDKIKYTRSLNEIFSTSMVPNLYKDGSPNEFRIDAVQDILEFLWDIFSNQIQK